MKIRALLVSSFVILVMLGTVPAVAQESESETNTHSSYQTTSAFRDEGSALHFDIVPVPVPSHPNYTGGTGSASIWAQGTTITVRVEVGGAAPGAHFTLLLAVNNSTQSIANMATGEEGDLEAESQVSLAAGNYSLGVQILDTSTFGSPTLVMASSPSTQRLQLPLPLQTTYTQSETEGQPVHTVGGTESDDGEVRTAIQSMVIPGVIDVGASGSSAIVVDNRFSISVGNLPNDGIIVSVSAANVTGPRVILVNLTAPAAQKLFSGSVSIALDGASIQQSTSVSQVLGVHPGDSSMFVIYSSKTGLKLLVSIPHFSFHTIQILPILAEIGSAILDFSSAILSVAGVSAVIFISYVRRTRFAV